MSYLKIIGFIFSLGGYFTFFNKKIDSHFVYLLTFSFISDIVYVGGIFHHLYLTSMIVYSLGIMLLLISLPRLFKQEFHFKLSLANVSFIIGSLAFLILLLHTHFIHYDNFSHWGIVVKEMLITNAFPTRTSSLIDFTNYPLGTSSLIYYGCLFLGHKQSIMLFIQGLLIFSAFYAMFGIIEEKKRFLLYSFLAAGCSLLSIFNITIRINNLLVDFILPVLSLASLAIIYTYRHDLKKTWILIPILGLENIVKSTGIIFSSIPLIYFIYIAFIDKKIRKKANILPFISQFLSFMTLILWQMHMKLEFSGVQNKFDLTDQSMLKTSEDIKQICKLYLHSCFDFTSRQTIGIFAFSIVVILICLFTKHFLNKKLTLFKTWLALIILLICYYFGILMMYIYSMPLDEAIYLAGFERYSSSIVVLFCGALMLCATIDLENAFSIKMGNHYDYKAFYSIKTKKYYQLSILITCAVCIITLLSEYNGLLYNQQEYPSSLPYEVEKVTSDHWDKQQIDQSKYIVYASDKDSQVTNYYLQYITRYMLYANHVDGICLFYEDNLINLLKDYDYLIIVESDSSERALLKKYFNCSGDEQIYKISDLFENMTNVAKKQYQDVKNLSQS